MSTYGAFEESMSFLSTPSARRATWSSNQPHNQTADFYPRPPRGGRHGISLTKRNGEIFLSTPSARRATSAVRCLALDLRLFLSTPSARRAT